MKKLLVLACLSVVVVGSWRYERSRRSTDTQDTESLVVDRLWIDHLPRSEREQAKVFVALSEESLGLFHTMTRWTGTYEAFRFQRQGNELRVVFPQNGDKEKLRVKARRCSEQGFQYCLDIDGGSRGVKRYYSMDGWEARSLDDEHRLAAQLER